MIKVFERSKRYGGKHNSTTHHTTHRQRALHTKETMFAIRITRTLNREAATLSSSAAAATLRPSSFTNSIIPTNNQTRRHYYNGEIATNDNSKQSKKNILILGSHGILGQTLVTQFQNNDQGEGSNNNNKYYVLTADVLSSDHPLSQEQQRYISLPQHGSIADVSLLLYRGVVQHLKKSSSNGGNNDKLDAIVVASGGWNGDVEYDDVVSNENGQGEDDEEEYIKAAAGVVDNMMRMNYYSVVAASLVGQRLMNPNGEFIYVLCGAYYKSFSDSNMLYSLVIINMRQVYSL